MVVVQTLGLGAHGLGVTWRILLATLVISGVVLLSWGTLKTEANPPGDIHRIKHVVIVMQENRSFDSYFGTYPGADGLRFQHRAATSCLPDPVKRVCVRPFHTAYDLNVGGPHGGGAYKSDMNGGKMNGFVRQERSYMRACSSVRMQVCSIVNNPPDVKGYHDGRDIPNYWAYARQFVLQDHMFSSNGSWSLPNHLYMVSGWSAVCRKRGQPASCVSAPVNPPAMWRAGFVRSTMASSPDYAWTGLTYLLHKNKVSWGYYVAEGNEPDCRNGDALCQPAPEWPNTPGFWNPLPFFDTVRLDGELGNVRPVQQFYQSARFGTLPAVSWVIPSEVQSEHPTQLVSTGQSYVTHLVNTLMTGPEWNSTAIFVTWDDWGGFYDHVVPPAVDGGG
ncbi:MAG: hypothetical protein NVSMB22_01680 [Chloroflexota bacterium]